MMHTTLSVIQLNSYIKRIFEQDYVLKNVTVEGELSNFKKHSSGHIYFTLKDDKAQVSCVLFKGYLTGEESNLHEGAKVVVKGSVSLFEKTGQYQIYVHKIEKAGIGELYVLFEKLKQKLQSEGLFDDSTKKPIYKYAQTIGVITSSTGAAIRDIVEIARRRNPYVQIILFASLVQGNTAKFEIVRGIEYFNTVEKVDTIIIGRGGGSIEDLWPFNEEMVARAVFASNIPVISAVGHETDFTISDFTADLRASTPSAAAELAVFDYYEWLRQIGSLRQRLDSRYSQLVISKREQLLHYEMRLKQMHPRRNLDDKRLMLDQLQEQLRLKTAHLIEYKRSQTRLLHQKLQGKSPLKRLEEGYALLSINGRRISSILEIQEEDQLSVFMSDGKVTTTVEKIEVL